jgi:glycosyltransferase involved in cell wall biosynthesis
MRRGTFLFTREYPPHTVGGTSTVARNLAVGLVRRGLPVRVLTTAPGAARETEETVDGVLVRRVPVDGVYDRSIPAQRRILAAAERMAADHGTPGVLVVPDLFSWPEAAVFRGRHAVPLINVLLQDFRAITPYDRDGHRVTTGVGGVHEDLIRLEENACRSSDHTVYISRALQDAITGHYPGIADRGSVVHLGVDRAEIDAVRADPEPLRRKAALLGDAPARLVVGAGRLVPVKGFGHLVEAVARINRGLVPGGPVRLVLLGAGPEAPHLRAQADDLVILSDLPRSEVLGWMSVADVAVVPSLWESFCYVCAEMMALERPVVATAVDSLRELIPDGSVGYPVPVAGPPGARRLDSAVLADRISAALTDPDAAGRGRAARRRVLAEFTLDQYAAGVAAVAEGLLAHA